MSSGITFYDRQEALSYMWEQYNEGYKTILVKEGSAYKVYRKGRMTYKEESDPSILRSLELEERSIAPGKSVHVTPKDLGKRTLLKKTGTSLEVLDGLTFPGISFAPTVEQALNALPIDLKEGKILYVYTPVKHTTGFIPIESDVEVSEEVRAPENVDASLVKKIFVKPVEKEDGTIGWDIKEIE